METTMAAVSVQRTGSLFLLRPNTPESAEWLESNVQQSAMWVGGAVVTEYRSARDLVDGLGAAGFTVA